MAFFVWCGCNHPNPTVSEKEHSSQEHKCQPEFFLTETVVRKGRDTVIFKYVLKSDTNIYIVDKSLLRPYGIDGTILKGSFDIHLYDKKVDLQELYYLTVNHRESIIYNPAMALFYSVVINDNLYIVFNCSNTGLNINYSSSHYFSITFDTINKRIEKISIINDPPSERPFQ